jgi:geranylgeranyl diphosphate synthase type II
MTRRPSRLATMIGIVGAAVGAPRGIVAGQAWECEPTAPLSEYQRAKTGALFIGAAQAGALAAGADPAPWRALGDKIGEAYQVADDLRDVLCDAEELGKPVGQDAARLRPNAAAQLGIGGAKARLVELVEGAVAAIPACPGELELRKLIKMQTLAFFPKQLAAAAA